MGANKKKVRQLAHFLKIIIMSYCGEAAERNVSDSERHIFYPFF
jgi:hypothetical protein